MFGYSIFISSAAAICYVNLLPRLSKKCLRYTDLRLIVFFSTIWSALLFVFKISESCFICYCTFRFLLIYYESMKLFQVFYVSVFVSKIWRSSSSCKLLSLLKNEMINNKSEKYLSMHVNDMQFMIEYIECWYRLKECASVASGGSNWSYTALIYNLIFLWRTKFRFLYSLILSLMTCSIFRIVILEIIHEI